MGSLCATLLFGALPAAAEEPSAPPDADFLEFLGSWDGEDEAWAEFLASTEIRDVSKAGKEEESESKQVDP